MTTIQISDVSGTDLHMQYPRQGKAQPCYVALDCETGALYAGVSGEVGSGVPARVYHGLVRRWHIPALTADAANELLAEIAPLAERVVGGFTREWDGHNHVGSLSDDAESASEAIEDLCLSAGGEGAELNVWEAAEWLGGHGGTDCQCRALGITAATTDDELEAIATQCTEEAEADGVAVLADLDRHLAWLRKQAIEQGE